MNMNYCKYENTAEAMAQIVEYPDPSNEYEEDYKEDLILLCIAFLEQNGFHTEKKKEV